MNRLLILAPVMLAGCTGQAIGPSLAKRPVEGQSFDEPARTAAAPVVADAGLLSRIADLVARAQAGQRAFADLLPRAREAASGAGAEGSEGWIAAQQLLSALESARAPSTQALGELDALLAERVNTGKEDGLNELQGADTQVSTLVDAQQSELASIRARISR
ncbi:hypothetical protein ACFSCW_11070 [Sphingomonas tabacisoli]|uniref:Uncharacterized protein n=1 Tax=Sphingomonas tabacisoli TaxID=2249466 RepID=A0ABW4I331_9SPHN